MGAENTLLGTRPRTSAASLLLAILLAGCGAERRPEAQDPTQYLYTEAYRQISETYLEPVTIESLAMAGLRRLSRLDAGFAVDRREDGLHLLHDGQDVDQRSAPAAQDARGWGDATAALVAKARTLSPDIAAKPADQVDEVVINGALTILDRFSQYARPDTARERRAERDGFSGIGAALDTRGSDIRVTSVMADGPAARAGLKADDRITAIDETPIGAIPRADIPERLRGPSGSQVALKILRGKATRPQNISITRAFLIQPTVAASHDDHIAVFRVTGFNHLTARSLGDRLRETRQEMGRALNGIVLDLRGNRGGLLGEAVDVASLFLEGSAVISITGRRPETIQRYAAAPLGPVERLPVAVLINGSSASSSEVVAAALQDAGRAVVIGSSSYGKGTVQTVLRLPNDGELTVTSARMIAPAGYFLNEHGVVPTICTSDLPDEASAVDLALRRAFADLQTGLAGQSRRGLDESAWRELRRQCQTQRPEHGLDIRVANRLLGDTNLYRRTLAAASPAVARAGAGF